MANTNYTLKNPLFKYGLQVGMEGQAIFSVEKPLLVVGGGATQLYVQDFPNLFRPTSDIDFITRGSTSKTERRDWAHYVSEMATKGGHNASGSLSRFGSEVRFQGLILDFLLHLDASGKKFYEAHENWTRKRFERARTKDFSGTIIRYSSPEDTIIHKIGRINGILRNGGGHLDSFQKELLNLISEANFNSVNPGDLEDTLLNLGSVRDENVEALGRLGYDQSLQKIQNYKISKDIYDMLTIIQVSRKNGEGLDVKEFRKNFREFLEIGNH